jgi:hypothetical protein
VTQDVTLCLHANDYRRLLTKGLFIARSGAGAIDSGTYATILQQRNSPKVAVWKRAGAILNKASLSHDLIVPSGTQEFDSPTNAAICNKRIQFILARYQTLSRTQRKILKRKSMAKNGKRSP